MGAPVLSRTVRIAPLRYGRIFGALLLGCFAFGSWCATQYVAYRAGFDPRLGAPTFHLSSEHAPHIRIAVSLCAGAAVLVLALPRLRGLSPVLALVALLLSALLRWPVYGPFQVISWAAAYRGVEAFAAVLEEARLAFVAGGTAALLATLPLTRFGKIRAASVSHGSSRWGDGSNLLNPGGLELGRRVEDGRMLYYPGEGHSITLSPTGGGKGVSSVIPNLLHHPGSAVVADVKPELYAVTARRRRQMGQIVRCIDPFELVGGSDGCNPMDWINPEGPDALDDADLIADMLVAIGERSKADEHWNEEALALLTGLILHVKTSAPPELQNLPYVRQQLMLPGGLGKGKGPFDQLLRDMLKNPAVFNLIHQKASAILQKASPERSGVISAAQSHTHFLSSPRMARVLSRSTFDFADLKRGRMTVYLVLPSYRLTRYNRFLRLMVGCAFARIAAIPGRPQHKIRFVLDEFTQLRRLTPIEEAFRLHRSKGIQFSLYIQDFPSFEEVYPRIWRSFLANTDVFQAFGANDVYTAEELSKRVGETTILVQSENRSHGYSRGKMDNVQEGSSETTSETRRRLMTPDEILRMKPEDELQLLFLKGNDPILAKRIVYFRDSAYAGEYDPNPEHQELVL